MKGENGKPVIDPVEKWGRLKEKFISGYNRHPFVKALAEYASESGRGACQNFYKTVYARYVGGYCFQARKISSELELLSPHSIPGTRLISGICSHSTGRNIFNPHHKKDN